MCETQLLSPLAYLLQWEKICRDNAKYAKTTFIYREVQAANEAHLIL